MLSGHFGHWLGVSVLDDGVDGVHGEAALVVAGGNAVVALLAPRLAPAVLDLPVGCRAIHAIALSETKPY